VAYDNVISADRLAPLVAEFYEEGSGTRLRFGAEVLEAAGTRCCPAVPTSPSARRRTRRWRQATPCARWGRSDWVFVVAPIHPLASLGRPVSASDTLGTRVVIVADSSRNLPRAVPGWRRPRLARRFHAAGKARLPDRGLGVGFLPAHLAAAALADGRLVKLEVEEPKPKTRVHFAWRPRDAGKALKWWVAKLEDEKVRERLLGGGIAQPAPSGKSELDAPDKHVAPHHPVPEEAVCRIAKGGGRLRSKKKWPTQAKA